MNYMYTMFSCPFYFLLLSCSAIDKITQTRSLRDPETLVSSNGVFEFGFFTPLKSTKSYVGIWYSNVANKDVVWVANRKTPLENTSNGAIRISGDGNMQILDGRNQTLWSSNVSLADQTDDLPVVRLSDSGNLVLGVNGSVLWQSFEHPTDTALPNMKLTVTENSGVRNMLQSWKDLSDPANGSFSIGIDSFAFPQLITWDGDRPYWRSGPWNGNSFIGMQSNNTDIENAGFILENDRQGTISLTYSNTKDMLSYYELNYRGTFIQKWWDENKNEWEVVWQAPETQCDVYGTCGAFGICNSFDTPICRCLKGFEPRNKVEWSKGNRTSGCIRRKQLQCGSENGSQDGFLKVTGVKVPDKADWSTGLDQNECRSNCLDNCSCLAYVYITGSGCMSWGRDLFDTDELSTGGVDLYLRLAQSELGNDSKIVVVVAVAGSLGAASIIFIILLLWRRKGRKLGRKLQTKKTITHANEMDKSGNKLEEVPLFEFGKLAMATNNFHDSNKLGRGGFGAVYRGQLEDGHEVAVKRLSSVSGQGQEEFMNEVSVISKLQHRNLVKLLGYCADGTEQILIYEYMPNKSLDSFIFDSEKSKLLSWERRYNIILGICRGLLYLHRDSRLRIIHRDLKASNILLDENLNPKISDFGMARIFWGNQDQDDTRRVVGTYGYMAPEYAMGGQFSEKSDVFSFGVLLIEIVSGKRNSLFSYKEQSLSLLGYAYKLWNEGNTISLIDPVITEPCFLEDIKKCIQVGLLCVQEFTKDRPSIATIISMLRSKTMNLPQPKDPGFIYRQDQFDIASSSQQRDHNSVNYVSITAVSGR